MSEIVECEPITGASREVTRCGWAGREIDDAHAHFAVTKHFLFHIHRPISRDPRFVFLRMSLVTDKDSKTEINSNTDTDDVDFIQWLYSPNPALASFFEVS
jgi:hypothetical protein